MPTIAYLASADRDFENIFNYLTRQSGNASVGRTFVNRLRAQCRHLAALPGTLGRARPELRPDIRSFAFGNYTIFFRYREDRFEVVNVLEGHRDFDTHFRGDSW